MGRDILPATDRQMTRRTTFQSHNATPRRHHQDESAPVSDVASSIKGTRMVAKPRDANADRASLRFAVRGSLAIDLYSIVPHLPGKLPSDSGRFSVRLPYSAHASSSNRAAGPSVEGAESQKRVSRMVWASWPAIVR